MCRGSFPVIDFAINFVYLLSQTIHRFIQLLGIEAGFAVISLCRSRHRRSAAQPDNRINYNSKVDIAKINSKVTFELSAFPPALADFSMMSPENKS